MAVIQRFLSAVRVIKAFGREDPHDRFLNHSRRKLSREMQVATFQSAFQL